MSTQVLATKLLPPVRLESRSPHTRVGWLSLDEGDDDPTRLLTHLAAVLRNAGVDVDPVICDIYAACDTIGREQHMQTLQTANITPDQLDALDHFAHSDAGPSCVTCC